MSSPSVGELLDEADREVRSILWDITELDGPALAASWPRFMESAHDALVTLQPIDTQAKLLVLSAEGPGPRPHRWGRPVDVAPDPRMERATTALRDVAELVGRHAGGWAGAAPDAEHCRRRVSATMYCAAHAARTGLREHAQQRQPARPGVAFIRPSEALVVPGLQRIQLPRLISAIEALEAQAERLVTRNLRFFGGSPTPHGGSDSPAHNLAEVLARWEITSRRLLAAEVPSVADLAGIATTQSAMMANAEAILRAAAVVGAADADAVSRAHPMLSAAQAAWSATAASWSGFGTVGRGPDPGGAQASTEVLRALHEITRDSNGWADPAAIASRCELPATIEAIGHAVTSGERLADRYVELPAELAAAGLLRGRPDKLPSGVSVDAHGRETVSLAIAGRSTVTVRPGQTDILDAAANTLMERSRALGPVMDTIRGQRTTGPPGQRPTRALDQTQPHRPRPPEVLPSTQPTRGRLAR